MSSDVTQTQTLANANGKPVMLEYVKTFTEQGKTDAEIADELGIGLGQVRRIAKRHGIKLNKVPAAFPPAAVVIDSMTHAMDAVATAAASPVQQRRRRQQKPKVEVTTPLSSLDFNVSYAESQRVPDEKTLQNLGSILLFAEKNRMTVESFVKQCRWVVDSWDAAMKKPAQAPGA